MPTDHPQAGSTLDKTDPSDASAVKASTACMQPRTLTATEKMRAFLRSGKYVASDSLDDYSADYHAFTPLGAVETADMRYHRERLRDAATAEPETDDSSSPAIEPLSDRDTVELPSAAGAEGTTDAQFVALTADRCLHRYARHEVCRRCIESCASGAMRPGDDTPQINDAACVGCAACVSACPTDALRWLSSTPQGLLQELRDAMTPHVRPGAAPIVMYIQQGTDFSATGLASEATVVVVEVATIGLVGMAALLTAMALGAAGVVILVDDTVGDHVRRRLSEEVHWSQCLLTAWGFSDDCIGLWPFTGATTRLPIMSNRYTVPPAQYSFDHLERILIRRAATHLAHHGRNPATIVALPAGAPFGTVQIDGTQCTLCMACAGACRMKALVAISGDAPGLGFMESLCVQCGACAHVCPEQAITLVPRLNPDPTSTTSRSTLHQTQPARCSVCGRVFASSQMIASIQRKLRGHWMYADIAAQNRLQMCDQCRVREIYLKSKPISSQVRIENKTRPSCK
jgi:ferredoxin